MVSLEVFDQLQERFEASERELEELKEHHFDHASDMADLKRRLLLLERTTKIEASNMSNWKDHVNDKLSTLNSKQSNAETEAMLQGQMALMYVDKEAKLKARIQ